MGLPDVLNFSAGEVVAAAKLRAVSFAMGRTRMLGKTYDGAEYGVPALGYERDLPVKLALGNVRSGQIVLVTWIQNDDVSNTADFDFELRKTSDDSVLDTKSATAVAGGAGPGGDRNLAFTFASVSTSEDMYLWIGQGGTPSGGEVIRDCSVHEWPGTPVDNVFYKGITADDPISLTTWDSTNLTPADPVQTWSHNDNSVAADFNAQITEICKNSLLFHSRNGLEYTTTATSQGAAFLDIPIGSIGGTRIAVLAQMKRDSDGLCNLRAEISDGTSDVLLQEMGTTNTSYESKAQVTLITSLATLGNMQGEDARIKLFLWNSGGTATVRVKNIHILQGTASDQKLYMHGDN